MTRFSILVLLVLVWCGFSDDFSLINIFGGTLIAFLIYKLIVPEDTQDIRFHPILFGLLILRTIRLLIISSFLVAWEILTPQQKSNPAIIKIPLDCKHRYQILLLAHIISVTPGTLCLDVLEEEKSVLIHAMFAEDEDKIVHEIKNKLERQVMAALEFVK